MDLEEILGRPPDAVNELGTKWWKDADTTEYAHSKGLKDAVVFRIETADRCRNLLLTERDKILFGSQQLESIAIQIDMIAMIRETNGGSNEEVPVDRSTGSRKRSGTRRSAR